MKSPKNPQIASEIWKSGNRLGFSTAFLGQARHPGHVAQVWDLRSSAAARSFEVSSREVGSPGLGVEPPVLGASNIKERGYDYDIFLTVVLCVLLCTMYICIYTYIYVIFCLY